MMFPSGLHQPLFENNLNFLKSQFPSIYLQVCRFQESNSQDLMVYQVSEDRVHYKIRVAQDQFLPIASPRNPEKEASRWLDQMEMNETDNVLLLGCGMGHALKMLSENPGAPGLIIVLEVSIPSFMLTLATIDLKSILSDSRFKLLLNPGLQEWFVFLQSYAFSMISNGIKVLKWPFALKHYNTAVFQYENKLNDFLRWAKVNMSTQSRMGELFSAHFFKNLKILPETLRLADFKNRYKHIPALIVSAGPSLNKNIYQIRNFRQQMLIFAVDTVLKYLIELDIAPHFVVSTDFTENALLYIKNKIPKSWQRPILIVDTEVYPGTPQHYGFPVLYCGIEGKSMNHFLMEVTHDLGTIPKGLSVSHTAYHAARYMGIQNIAFIGQDLSYSQGQLYFQGAAHEVPIAKEKTHGVQIHGWFGITETSHSLKIFLDHFEEIFWQENKSVKIYNATEGGALIAGSFEITLKEWLSRFVCGNKTIGIELENGSAGKINLSDLKKHMERKITEFEGMMLVLSELLKRMKKMIGSLNKGKTKEFYGEYRHYQDALSGIQKFQHLMLMIRDNMIEALIVQSKRVRKYSDERGVEIQTVRIKEQIEKDLIYFDRMHHATGVLLQQMREFTGEKTLGFQ